ncbi:hypothetical protein [Actinosynnema sp. NPDC020468]|uniref:hypothetical protein n=1 Tax=Actinosynnema sp. NPDC020468 TaxID=3154488 RepID=UPI0033EE2693
MSTQTGESTAVAVAVVEEAPPVDAEVVPEAETTAVVSAAAGTVPPVVEGGTTVAASTPGRVPRPMVVAAAIAGVVLVALPFGFIGLSGDDKPGEGPANAGYSQDSNQGSGFVPGIAAAEVPGQQPSAEVVPTAAEPTGEVKGVPADVAGTTAEAGTPAGEGTPAVAGQPPATATPGQPAAPGGQIAPQQKQAAPTYAATAGPGCAGSTKFTGYGSYKDGKKGWVDNGSGCGSAFVSVPMSGDAKKDDASAYGLWTFNTGPVTAGTCAVSVYVPNGDVTVSGGNPTSYRVYDRFDVVQGSPVGSFDVKQVSSHGQWVSVGTFRINGAKLAVQLLTRGQDWQGSTKTYAHHAAGAVKASCQA